MSVSLCVLRFEIADSYEIPSSLKYIDDSASMELATEKDSGNFTSSDQDLRHGTQAGQGAKAEGTPSKDVMKKHRGKREVHEIVIETHSVVSKSGCSESPVQSKESSPCLSEGGVDKKQPRMSSGQISFFSGNPFVEMTKGILHLFKENTMTSLTDDVPRSEMLCILAVPASMTSHDLLQFTAPCRDNIGHIRIIRDSTPNQYMVLIKFRNQPAADEFYRTYNGTQFNTIEPEICHLVYISRVETAKEFDAGSFPLEGHTELPTCPVCLERMDESVDGILTILCNHSFHSSCLDKWDYMSCPVCRYCLTPEVVAENHCSECHVQESLWICLICGHVGCGRYVEGHAYNHFVETQHTYAMQLGNNRVWDYAGDNYVHRLIQNKADGKLVEFNERPAVEQDEKLDSMQLEYTYLLTSQLESQRLYFEGKITRIERESLTQIEELKDRMKKMAEDSLDLKHQLDIISRDKLSQDKRVHQLQSKVQKANKELTEERQINECLRDNQQQWHSRVEELEAQLKKTVSEREKEVEDLKEQLRDVMFFIEARQTLQNAPDVSQDEIREGQIVVGQQQHRTASGSGQATMGSHQTPRSARFKKHR